MQSDLEYFMRACDRLREKTTNCDNSRKAFANAVSIPEATAAFRQFWVAVVQQVPRDFIITMLDVYPRFRKDMNAAGVYFNEVPADSINAIVFVGGIDNPPVIDLPDGRMRVVVAGKADVTVGGHIRCRCYCPDATVTCKDHSRLTMESGTARAYGRSDVTGRGGIHSYDSSTVRIYGGTLHDHGHLEIHAYNDAVVYSSGNRNIKLYDQSQLISI